MLILQGIRTVLPAFSRILEARIFRTDPYCLMGLLLFDRQAFQQPSGLLRRDIPDLFFRLWPLKSHFRKQFFGCKKETILIKTQGFYTILFPVAEQEHTDRGIGIQMISQADHSGQSLDLFAEICRAAGKIDVFRSLCDQVQHEACRILSIPANCESSA